MTLPKAASHRRGAKAALIVSCGLFAIASLIASGIAQHVCSDLVLAAQKRRGS